MAKDSTKLCKCCKQHPMDGTGVANHIVPNIKVKCIECGKWCSCDGCIADVLSLRDSAA